MDNKDEGLEQLCGAYLDLDNDDREKVIKLGEGLLKSQKTMNMETVASANKNNESQRKIF